MKTNIFKQENINDATIHTLGKKVSQLQTKKMTLLRVY